MINYKLLISVDIEINFKNIFELYRIHRSFALNLSDIDIISIMHKFRNFMNLISVEFIRLIF